MPKGGARTRSGPAPDPNALARERDEGEWSVLPATGREGPTPSWPLVDSIDRELDLWARLWKLPQALMWERFAQEHQVALYVRRCVESEERGSQVNLSTLVRQMADGLGLTTPGLRANRWRIDPIAEPEDDDGAGSADSGSRGRLTLVTGAGG